MSSNWRRLEHFTANWIPACRKKSVVEITKTMTVPNCSAIRLCYSHYKVDQESPYTDAAIVVEVTVVGEPLISSKWHELIGGERVAYAISV